MASIKLTLILLLSAFLIFILVINYLRKTSRTYNKKFFCREPEDYYMQLEYLLHNESIDKAVNFIGEKQAGILISVYNNSERPVDKDIFLYTILTIMVLGKINLLVAKGIMNCSLKNDFGLDSLKHIELICYLEKYLNIYIPDNQTEKMYQLSHVFNTIKTLVK